MHDSVKDALLHSPRTIRLRACALVCGVALMALVPAAALNEPRPSPLGWHMYASAVDLPRIEVVLKDGSRAERGVASIASGFRPEIDYFEPVARFICSSESGVVAVEMKRNHPRKEVVFQCLSF